MFRLGVKDVGKAINTRDGLRTEKASTQTTSVNNLRMESELRNSNAEIVEPVIECPFELSS